MKAWKGEYQGVAPETVPAVLLGGAMNGLSVSRTLWRMGIPVDVLDDGVSESTVRYSLRCRRHVPLQPGGKPGEQWLSYLLAEAEPSVILPCCDDGLELIARHRAELEHAGHRPAPANDEVVLALLDKARTYDLARAAGVPAPRTRALTCRDDLATVEDFLFPAAIKPVNSHVFSRRYGLAAKGAFVQGARDAVRIAGPAIDEGVPMLLTEVIEGTDECCSFYTYIDPDGTPLTQFTKRKLRQYPTRFGLGTYHLTKWSAEVAELGLKFFQGIGLRGLGNVEFKRDSRDGVLKIIESNPRFTNANELVRAAGIDFARVAYARTVGLPPPPLDSFRDDLAMWYPVDDFRAMRQYRRDGELTAPAWLRSLAHRQCHAEFDWADPGPSLATARRARAIVATVGSAARARHASGRSST